MICQHQQLMFCWLIYMDQGSIGKSSYCVYVFCRHAVFSSIFTCNVLLVFDLLYFDFFYWFFTWAFSSECSRQQYLSSWPFFLFSVQIFSTYSFMFAILFLFPDVVLVAENAHAWTEFLVWRALSAS